MNHGLLVYMLVSLSFFALSGVFILEARKINTQLTTIVKILKKQGGLSGPRASKPKSTGL